MRENTKRAKRVGEIDFLKAICIILMVVFHLVYFGDKYPVAKHLVYIFHMPIFLLISGYLSQISRGYKPFFRSMWWIFIPYAVMEVGYVVMSSILPVREGVDELSLSVIANKLFIHPLGPYWYLHTLIICSITYFGCFNLVKRATITSRLLLFAIALYLLGDVLHLIAISSGLYFFFGVMLRQSGIEFTRAFKASWLAIIPFVWLCLRAEELERGGLNGVILTVAAILLLLYCYKIAPKPLVKLTDFIGANTLPILLFSPIFTMIAKFGVRFFAFEPTGILFALCATTFAICGSFAIAYSLDKLRISPFLIGKRFIA